MENKKEREKKVSVRVAHIRPENAAVRWAAVGYKARVRGEIHVQKAPHGEMTEASIKKKSPIEKGTGPCQKKKCNRLVASSGPKLWGMLAFQGQRKT